MQPHEKLRRDKERETLKRAASAALTTIVEECRLGNSFDCQFVTTSATILLGGLIQGFCKVHKTSQIQMLLEVVVPALLLLSDFAESGFYEKIVREAHEEKHES